MGSLFSAWEKREVYLVKTVWGNFYGDLDIDSVGWFTEMFEIRWLSLWLAVLLVRIQDTGVGVRYFNVDVRRNDHSNYNKWCLLFQQKNCTQHKVSHHSPLQPQIWQKSKSDKSPKVLVFSIVECRKLKNAWMFIKLYPKPTTQIDT